MARTSSIQCHGCCGIHTRTDTHMCMRARTHTCTFPLCTHVLTHVPFLYAHTYSHMQARTHTHVHQKDPRKCRSVHARARTMSVYMTTSYSPPLDSFSTLHPICHEKRANMAHTTNRTILNMTRGDIPPRLEQGGDCRGRGRFSSTFVSLGPSALSSSSALTVEEGFM